MTLRAWIPAARGLPLPTIGAVLALSVAPTAGVFVEQGRDLSGAVVAAAVIGAAGVAFFVDDPAGETLSASPTSLARRRVLRLAGIVLGMACTYAVLIAVVALRDPVTFDDLISRAAEVAAVSGLAAAAGGLAHRHGAAAAGPAGAVAGALTALVVAALSVRYQQLPGLLTSAHHTRWWLVALVSWTVAAWTSRDPSR